MKRILLALAAAIAAIATFTVSAQQNADRVRALPGDRPAANTPLDALGGARTQRDDRDEPAAGIRRRA